MLRGESLEKKTDVILLSQGIATESRKEKFGNCFLNIGEFAADSSNDSLYKLPFLLKRILQACIGRLWEDIGYGG
jgi:hypothetical protein